MAEAALRDRPGTGVFGAIEVAGARTVQARGIRRGEIVDMEEVCRTIRLALLTAEKMAAPKVERVDQVIVSFSGGRPVSHMTAAEIETETGQVTDRDLSEVLAQCPAPEIGEGLAGALVAFRGVALEASADDAHQLRRRLGADHLDRGRVVGRDGEEDGPLVVGGERHGVPTDLRVAADVGVRVPMAGFIPSYNVQAALAIVVGERLRQRGLLCA
jgi:hypothetical protein